MSRSRLQGEFLDVQVHKDSSLASTAVAEEIMQLIKETAAEGRLLKQCFRPCSNDNTSRMQ